MREANPIFEELGDRTGAAWSLNQRGDIACEKGELAAARDLYQGALAALGHRPFAGRFGLHTW